MMFNEYLLEVGGIVGEDCAYLIREDLEKQLGKIDLFTCLSTKEGAELSRYQCKFRIVSSASLEAIRQCKLYPYQLMSIKKNDTMTPFFNTKKKAQEEAIKISTQKERLAPQPETLVDLLLDPITKEVMTDPVVTPSGNTYQKSSIIKYLTTHRNEPNSLNQCSSADLRANRNIQEIVNEHLKGNLFNTGETFDFMLDPITYEIMTNPVITPSGQSFQKEGVEKHLATYKTDPMTGLPCSAANLIPNLLLDKILTQNLLTQALTPKVERKGW